MISFVSSPKILAPPSAQLFWVKMIALRPAALLKGTLTVIAEGRF